MIKRSFVFGMLVSAVLAVACAKAQDSRNLLESKESLYNNIYVYSEPPYVSMTFGHNRRIYTESMYNTHRQLLDEPVLVQPEQLGALLHHTPGALLRRPPNT